MAFKILGLMSGSSLDGLDLAICHFSQEGYVLLETKNIPFNSSLINRLKDPFSLPAIEFIKLEAEFSSFIGNEVVKFLSNSDHNADLIVSHGHTIYHNPEKWISCQIGNGGVIASMTGIDTLCDLRIQDVVLGGQGAPLASLVDRYLFPDSNIKLNLGGIANISINEKDQTKSWDITPCNQVLNYLAGLKGRPYDDRGSLARRGKFNESLYSRWKRLDYFRLYPPKSMDNFWIKENFLTAIREVKVGDALYTATHFIADTIANDLNHYLTEGDHSMMITGGGAYNDFLIECINDKTSIEVIIPESKVIDYKEALLMAFMGYKYLNGEVNVLSSATGSEKDIIAGALYRGNGKK